MKNTTHRPAASRSEQTASTHLSQVDFAALLDQALTEPGALSSAYRAFHSFSALNQSLAYLQCKQRGIEVSPLASFSAWKTKGRTVRKGEKAISLFMPLTKQQAVQSVDGSVEESTRTFFALKPHWFVLSQTEGAETEWPALPDWDLDRALNSLRIAKVNFAHLNGNCQGYAQGTSIAVNPLAAYPVKTACHEIAHVLLGHTVEVLMSDDDTTPRNLREVEAESVAYLVTSILGLPGQESSRAYIQGWLGCDAVPDQSVRKVFACADRILKAGR